MMETRIVAADAGIDEAARLLQAGEVIGIPTETVYGLAGDARNESAVQKIYDAKGRPPGNPVIVHVASLDAARACAATWPDAAEKLSQKFWPGPLTIIVKRGPGISPLVSAGRDTVAIRWPNHPVAQELLQQFNAPVAAPSANRSGFTSPTTAQHVLAELDGRIPLVLDGGPCDIGLESTVIDLTTQPARILRPGAITAEMLRPILGQIETVHTAINPETPADSPGTHHSHYAPRTAAFAFTQTQWPAAKQFAQTTRVVLITHDPAISLAAPHEVILLPSDAPAYARTMYAALRDADAKSVPAILILIPESHAGIWTAIRDRLARATRELTV